ncbi:MAG: tRNA (adenosine(37)-N6)-threonylcarbamoyltransferase complex dimerization subunit type 1 TsaB [Oscillospiraceae bacterium]
MIIFAVDSSSCAGSAAVYKDGTILAESFANVGLTHSETLMVLCDEVFRRSGIGPCDVDYFAVTSGPGSFTGLRIGMGTVKGMAFATRKPCVAVPTSEALACGLAPCDRLIVTALDARQKRVYASAFKAEGNCITQVLEDCVLTFDELFDRIKGSRVIFAGDASQLCDSALKGRLDMVLPSAANMFVRASSVAVAANLRIEKGLICSCSELAPTYLQQAQAERELLKKRNGEKK